MKRISFYWKKTDWNMHLNEIYSCFITLDRFPCYYLALAFGMEIVKSNGISYYWDGFPFSWMSFDGIPACHWSIYYEIACQWRNYNANPSHWMEFNVFECTEWNSMFLKYYVDEIYFKWIPWIPFDGFPWYLVKFLLEIFYIEFHSILINEKNFILLEKNWLKYAFKWNLFMFYYLG